MENNEGLRKSRMAICLARKPAHGHETTRRSSCSPKMRRFAVQFRQNDRWQPGRWDVFEVDPSFLDRLADQSGEPQWASTRLS